MATTYLVSDLKVQRPVHPASLPKVVGAQSIPVEYHASVKHLAAAHSCFVRACDSQDSQELVFWGRTLLSDQASSGIELIPGAAIEATVRKHAERLKRRGLN